MKRRNGVNRNSPGSSQDESNQDQESSTSQQQSGSQMGATGIIDPQGLFTDIAKEAQEVAPFARTVFYRSLSLAMWQSQPQVEAQPEEDKTAQYNNWIDAALVEVYGEETVTQYQLGAAPPVALLSESQTQDSSVSGSDEGSKSTLENTPEFHDASISDI